MKRIVIKLGTQLLTTPTGLLDLNNLRNLVYQLSDCFHEHNYQLVLVSSGAITCGAEHMKTEPKSIPDNQAAAAVGQPILIKQYFNLFQEKNIAIAQLLLTKDGLDDNERRDHAKNTLEALLEKQIIPIINENDSVAIEEIRFGDNDQLAASVAKLIKADTLILLTNKNGLYSHHPDKHDDAKLLEEIDEVTDEILSLADDEENNVSRGGMKSKLLATKTASENGIDVMIANGRSPNIVSDCIKGIAKASYIKGRKK